MELPRVGAALHGGRRGRARRARPAAPSCSATRAPAGRTRSCRPGWDAIPARAAVPRGLWFPRPPRAVRGPGRARARARPRTAPYQREMAERLELPFPVLSDERLELVRRAAACPTFETAAGPCVKRITLVIDDGRIEHVFYPVFPPDAHAGEVLEWLRRLSGALADSEQKVFWLDSPDAPEPLPPLEGEPRCDLAIVGGGFTGLWAALLAAPDEDVVLLEGDRCGWGASGRNGGFLDASLTHGLENGLSRWPDEMERLTALGDENFDAIRDTLRQRGIDAGWEENGFIDVATRAHEVEGWPEAPRRRAATAKRWSCSTATAVRAGSTRPPTSPGSGTRRRRRARRPGSARVGLRRAALEDGVRVHEGTQVTAMRRDGEGVLLETPRGRVRASAGGAGHQRVPAAGALDRPLRDPGLRLRARHRAARPGAARGGRLGGARGPRRLGQPLPLLPAHRRRPHPVGRLRGGLPLGNGMRPELEESAEVFNLLAHNFAETFPQLEGLRFTHRWAGAIDTSSRFCVTFGTALGGRVAYAVGYTGLGVGASRFGARVALDLVHGRDTELTRLELVRSRPIPFPPEPLRYAVVQATRRALIRADERRGRRAVACGCWTGWARASTADRAGRRGFGGRPFSVPGEMAEYRPKNRGLERVLGTGALFSTAYGNVGSSIYYALGLVAIYAARHDAGGVRDRRPDLRRHGRHLRRGDHDVPRGGRLRRASRGGPSTSSGPSSRPGARCSPTSSRSRSRRSSCRTTSGSSGRRSASRPPTSSAASSWWSCSAR